MAWLALPWLMFAAVYIWGCQVAPNLDRPLIEAKQQISTELAKLQTQVQVATSQTADAGRDVKQVVNDGAVTRSYIRWMGGVMLAGLAVVVLVIGFLVWWFGYRKANWERKQDHILEQYSRGKS